MLLPGRKQQQERSGERVEKQRVMEDSGAESGSGQEVLQWFLSHVFLGPTFIGT